MVSNPTLELAFEYVQYTSKNIFLTGKAGTGKTTFLKSLKDKCFKRMAIVAPTGVAAINAGGQTIHSFFQLPFGPIPPERVTGIKLSSSGFQQKFNKKKINIFKSLDLLIIDEISMVRADLLDAIDETLRRYNNRYLPFGGIQLLMIGDLQQLAPVVKENEWNLLKKYYKSMFFFNSVALKEAQMISIELKHVYRQSDEKFINILNQIRNDQLSKESLDMLHSRYQANYVPDKDDGYITLTTHNNSAQKINDECLSKIKSKEMTFDASIKGQFSEYSYPTEEKLNLKVGAQVMFVKNDHSYEKRYYNGKIGRVVDFEDDLIVVSCEGDTEYIYTSIETWENIKYNIDEKTKEIEKEIVGSFTQYPLKTAWAITIHKSQGLTFEKAVIDAASAFAHGQTYVALSRCKTLEGLILSTKISESAIICDSEVNTFNQYTENNQPNKNNLEAEKHKYKFELLKELFTYNELYYIIQRLERNIEDNIKTINGNLKTNIINIQQKVLPEINGIAKKFTNQISELLVNNPDIESNEALKERLKKAAEYFFNYHENNIINPIKNSTFESDNKATIKSVEENIVAIIDLLKIKQETLKSCKSGFELSSFLSTKAKAAISETKNIRSSKRKQKDVETKHPELYSTLKFWRREEADIRMVSLFQIMSQKALQAIANELPNTELQLLSIQGIGKKKIEEFGIDIIDIVNEYIEENNIIKEEEKTEKKSKKKNHEKTYELYLKGRSIDDITKELGFAVSTIETHLCIYVSTGKLDADEFVNQETIDNLSKYISKKPTAGLNEIRTEFNNKYSYSQIKFVKSHIEFESRKI